MYNRLDVEFWGLTPTDVAELPEALDQYTFFSVSTTRQPPPPLASPLLTDFAPVLVIIGIAAHGFLNELGKDLYQQFRKALVRLADRSKRIVDERGSRNILIVRVERETAYVDFFFTQPPAENELAIALTSIQSTLAEIADGQFTSVQFDFKTQRWAITMVADEETARALARNYRPHK